MCRAVVPPRRKMWHTAEQLEQVKQKKEYHHIETRFTSTLPLSTLLCSAAQTIETSPHVQDGWAQKFAQHAGRIGRG